MVFSNVSSYKIESTDVCQSKTNELGIITRSKPQGPSETTTMGKYGCSAYSENSCCTEEESYTMYHRPLDRVEWWDFGVCVFNPNKAEECNSISDTCTEYIQSYLSGLYRLLKNLACKL